MAPTVFVSYSHDSEEHKAWVLRLATRLRHNGVDMILDQWNLQLGQDVAAFVERGLSDSNRVLCICSGNYIRKANAREGGVGYEKRIMTGEIMGDLNADWVIPVICNNPVGAIVPTFLRSCLYVDFRDDLRYEEKYEELLRSLLDEPVLPIPQIGENPFETIKTFSNQRLTLSSGKHVSPSPKGRVTFDYSNNNGRYCIGSGEQLFEIDLSKSSDRNIQLLSDPNSIRTVAIAKGCSEIENIVDARKFDGSSRVRRPRIGQVAVLQNGNGYWAAIKVLGIMDDTRSDDQDEVTFEYVIQTNGSPCFVR